MALAASLAALGACSVEEDGLPGPGDGEDSGDIGAPADNGASDSPDDENGTSGTPGGDPSTEAYCDPAAGWPASQAAIEDELLTLVNQRRSQGARCGTQDFGPTQPLTMNTALRCAARVHSLDMFVRDFFSHTNPDGQAPWDRMILAGYNWRRAGENIAFGSTTAAGVMTQWMSSAGHCANIMSPNFVHIGIGYHAEGRLWTQVFGTPR